MCSQLVILITEKSMEFFTNEMDFEEVENKEGKKYFVTGYISTYDRDLVNDIVTPGCMKDMLDQLRERNIKLDLEHECFKGETNFDKQLNKTIVPIGRIIEADIDNKGIFIRAKMNPHNRRFDEAWGSIKEKMLDAFSIAYKPVETVDTVTKDGPTRLLDKLNLFNVGLTGNPANPNCTMGAMFVKSLDDFKYRTPGASDVGPRKRRETAERVIPDKYPSGKPIPKKLREKLILEFMRIHNKKSLDFFKKNNSEGLDMDDEEKDKIEAKSKEFEDKNTELVKEKEELTKENEKLNEDMKTLKEEMEALKEKVSAKDTKDGEGAEDDADKEDQESKELKEKFEGLEKEVKELKTILTKSDYKAKNEDMKKVLSEEDIKSLDKENVLDNI